MEEVGGCGVGARQVEEQSRSVGRLRRETDAAHARPPPANHFLERNNPRFSRRRRRRRRHASQRLAMDGEARVT